MQILRFMHARQEMSPGESALTGNSKFHRTCTALCGNRHIVLLKIAGAEVMRSFHGVTQRSFHGVTQSSIFKQPRDWLHVGHDEPLLLEGLASVG